MNIPELTYSEKKGESVFVKVKGTDKNLCFITSKATFPFGIRNKNSKNLTSESNNLKVTVSLDKETYDTIQKIEKKIEKDTGMTLFTHCLPEYNDLKYLHRGMRLRTEGSLITTDFISKDGYETSFDMKKYTSFSLCINLKHMWISDTKNELIWDVPRIYCYE